MVKENFWDGFGDSMKYSFPPIISQKKKKDLISIISDKVDLYKPKIEEKIGFKLTPVAVKNFSERSDALYFRDLNKFIISNPSKNNDKLSIFMFATSFYTAKIISDPILACMPFLFSYDPTPAAVYLNLSWPMRYVQANIKEELSRSDDSVVHELSHHIWANLSGSMIADFHGNLKKAKPWIEGFAEYCAHYYFEDLYTKKPGSHMSYRKHVDLIQKCLEKYGEDILFEIPSRWKEFDAAMNVEK